VLPALAVEPVERIERVDEGLLRDVLGIGAAAESPCRQRAIRDSSSSSRLAAARIAASSGDASTDADTAPLSSGASAITPEV
jgi:hypothetical protein